MTHSGENKKDNEIQTRIRHRLLTLAGYESSTQELMSLGSVAVGW